MSQETVTLSVLGLEVAFRSSADMSRVKDAVALVEKRFADQKLRSRGGQNRETLLTFLALGLADDLLQAENRLDEVDRRIGALTADLLAKIDKSA